MGKLVQPIRGMNDILPEQNPGWAVVESAALAIFEAYGYQRIRIPVLERTELYRRSIGESTDLVEKEMYSFDDRNGDSLTLRPEATAGIVRAGLSHGLFHNQQQKLWCSGPMFRHEKPQKARYRQFHQLNLEAVGFEGPEIDAELIVMSARLWERLGLKSQTLELNSLGTPASRGKYREALVDHFTRSREILDADSHERPAGAKDVVVSTRIERPSGPPITAEWRVRVTDGRLRIIDVSIEGVSMVVTQRSEFASVIQRNGVEGLIEVLRARTTKMSITAAVN